MTRVIAVQEEQLKIIRDKYKNALPLKETQNNADVLNDSLASELVVPTINSGAPIDMESQTVNLASDAMEPNVVNNDVTDQVFGVASGAINNVPVMPTVDVASPVIGNAEIVDNGISSVSPVNEVPFQVPQVGEQKFDIKNDDEIMNLINSVRNEFDSNIELIRNSFHKGMDKIQEQMLQKSGVSLIDNNVPVSIANVSGNSLPETISNEFAVSNNVGNIFDVDRTVVVPGNEWSKAIDEAQNGMAKVA